jgi:antitoxin MazE
MTPAAPATPELVESAKLRKIGNSIGLHFKKSTLRQAGIAEDAKVNVRVESRGRIVIEALPRKRTLEQLLERYDPERHGGDTMDLAPVGNELW